MSSPSAVGRSGAWIGAASLAIRYLPIVLFLLVWQILVATKLVSNVFLPSVVEVSTAFVDLAARREFWINLSASLFRAGAGLVIGAVVGISIGLLMATSKRASEFFGPLVSITYSLPKTALVPLFILWFGIGDLTNILTVAISCLLPITVSTYHGVKSVPAVLLWSARAMGTPRGALLYRILIPSSLMSILTGVRIALGFSLVLTLSAEMIAARSGIGKLIYLYGENGSYPHMFAGIAAVVGLAFCADRALLAWMKHLLRWHDSVESVEA